ncbi:MAG: ROK family transcriptional regulator [Acidobacteria bacterium]|nr:ROK family transcriptional regulator [Acidobacteriota bacterium]MBK8150531.1 ROK family transcriptional regulator [Acidobacteriota bacterium]MBK8810925.1 ROK family transcriptional regulator [Acidobacteriota bacterium]
MKRIYLQQAKTQIARPNTIRDINKQIVLNYVRDRAPISRAEIARETALQRSTISAIVEDLQKAGLIEEIGTGDSTGGRKPTLLRLLTQTPVAIGVDVAPRITTVAIADLAGNVLEMEQFPSLPDMEQMTRAIIERVAAFALKYKNAELEVGISVPGIADQTSGNVVYIPFFGWSDWNIADAITHETGLSVTVENDANAIALAELWFGEEKIRRTSNFITILVADGVGTGIIFDGQIYRGEKGAAGEFGHMIVGKNAPVPCSCGSRDCWEAHASERAVLGRYLSYNGNGESVDLDFDGIVRLAGNDDAHAVRAFRETAGFLGIGISNLIVGLSPQAIVVAGKVTKAWHLIESELNDIADRSVRRGLPKTTISASTLGDLPTLIGALSLVLARKFASAS